MGLAHGGYCLGCCWLLFVVLFPLGIMNIAAMAVITLLVFAEKTLPWGRPVVRTAAGALIAYGAMVLILPQLLPTFMEGMGATAEAAPTSSDPDYRFELVEVRSAGAGKTILSVRLAHLPEDKPVEGAAIREAGTNMGPGGMPDMTGKVTPLPPDHPGTYRFLIETGMAGKWKLTIGVEVQGGAQTIRGAVLYEVSS